VKRFDFLEFKAAIDGKAASIILSETRRMKRRLAAAIAQRRFEGDTDVRKIWDFCMYLDDTLELPLNLSLDERAFYERTMRKLVERKRMPAYVLDVFEDGWQPAS
jgi:hypothetical protein